MKVELFLDIDMEQLETDINKFISVHTAVIDIKFSTHYDGFEKEDVFSALIMYKN